MWGSTLTPVEQLGTARHGPAQTRCSCCGPWLEGTLIGSETSQCGDTETKVGNGPSERRPSKYPRTVNTRWLVQSIGPLKSWNRLAKAPYKAERHVVLCYTIAPFFQLKKLYLQWSSWSSSLSKKCQERNVGLINTVEKSLKKVL